MPYYTMQDNEQLYVREFGHGQPVLVLSGLGIQEVAHFICEEGLKGDVVITELNDEFILDTFGIYINKIADMEYRSELLKVLIPMQQHIDGTEEFFGQILS